PRYSRVLQSRVAIMSLSFKAVVDVTRIEPPTTIDATVAGDAIGLPGHLVATARVELREAGGGRTIIRSAAAVGLTGKLGGLGEPVFRATSARLAREFGA